MTTWTVGGRKFHLRWWPDMAWRIAVGALAALVVAGTVVALTRADLGRDQADSDSAGTSMSDASAPVARELRGGVGDSATATGGTSSAGSGAAVVGGDETASATNTGSVDAGSGAGASSVPTFSPKIIQTADIRVRVSGSFTAAVERANAVAGALGGFVTSSSTSALERGKSSAELTLRVPAGSFDEARRRLTGLGKLESQEVSGRDVSGQLVDLDARLRAVRAEEGALELLLGKAGDIGQILQVRDRLTAVRTEIEQMDGQQAALRDQVAMSTLHVSLHESGAAVDTKQKKDDEKANGIGESASDAINAAEAVVGGMLIVLGAVSPLLAVALLGWLVYWLIARRRRVATTP